jgi:hypothetical protein
VGAQQRAESALQVRHEACPYDEPHFERSKLRIMTQHGADDLNFGRKRRRFTTERTETPEKSAGDGTR